MQKWPPVLNIETMRLKAGFLGVEQLKLVTLQEVCTVPKAKIILMTHNWQPCQKAQSQHSTEAVLISLAAFQVYYLRSYFEVKQIV